jgi:Na+-driven multidrug efflux pump
MTLPRLGLDPVMVQTFDMVQKWGAQGAARGTIVKRLLNGNSI